MTGRAVGLLLDVLNPDTVVVTEVGAIHREDCLAALREEVGPDRAAAVAPTSFPDSVLAVAGGSVALDVLYRDPLGVFSGLPAPRRALHRDRFNSENPNVDRRRTRPGASCP